MRIQALPRLVLLIIWGLLGVWSLYGALFTLTNYYFDWRPDKVSAELPTTLFFSGFALFFGIIGCLLFATLLRRSRWLFPVYWFAVFATTLFLLTTIAVEASDVAVVLVFGAMLAALGVLVSRKRIWLGYRPAA